MGDSVVVTGAGGRIGGAIAARFRSLGRLHAGIDRTPGEYVSDVVDLADSSADTAARLLQIMAGADTLIHAAAHPGPSLNQPPGPAPGWGEAYISSSTIGLEPVPATQLLVDNLVGSLQVFEAAAACGVKRVVFSSSAFAQGWCHDPVANAPAALPISDADDASPFETYGLSKEVGEKAAAMIARTTEGRTSFISLRFTNIVKRELFGSLPWPAPPLPPPAVPSEVSASNRPLPLVFWAWTHEDDVIEAHMLAADAPNDRLFADPKRQAYTSFLIAAPSTRFAEPTEDLLVGHFGADRAATIVRKYPLIGNTSVLSSERARRVLGWTPRCWTQPSQLLRQLPGARSALAARKDQGLRSYSLAGFELESGVRLGDGAAIKYKVHGKLPYEGGTKPVVLHPTSFDAVHTDLEYQIGPGKALDTDLYTVIVPNLCGNGVSFSPSLADPETPYPAVITIDDNVRAQRMLLTGELGLDLVGSPLALVFGYSMGAMQALSWARQFPGEVSAAVAVCGAAVCGGYNHVFLSALDATLTADPSWDHQIGAYTATPDPANLRAFARIYAGWGVGSTFYRDEVWRSVGFSSLEDFLVRSYEQGFGSSYEPDLLAQLNTWKSTTPDPTRLDGLGKITAKVLLMPCTTDRYFPVDEIASREATLIPRAKLVPIDSPWGHRAGDPGRPGQETEKAFIRNQVHAFLGHSLQSSL